MEIGYITELRGGWDEWTDKYKEIMGIRIKNHEFYGKDFMDGSFIDKEGNILEVTFPPRRTDHKIIVQNTGKGYEFKKVFKSNLEDNIKEIKNEEKIVVNYQNLENREHL